MAATHNREAYRVFTPPAASCPLYISLPPSVHRCKQKHKKHVNNYLIQCSGVCNGTSMDACQRALRAVCDASTGLGGGNRRMEGSEGEVQAVEPVIYRELIDGTCANSARIKAAIVTGQPLSLVDRWVAGTA